MLQPLFEQSVALALLRIGEEDLVVQLGRYELLQSVARLIELLGLAAVPQRMLCDGLLGLVEEGLHRLRNFVHRPLRVIQEIAHEELDRAEEAARGGLLHLGHEGVIRVLGHRLGRRAGSCGGRGRAEHFLPAWLPEGGAVAVRRCTVRAC